MAYYGEKGVFYLSRAYAYLRIQSPKCLSPSAQPLCDM